MRLAIAIVLLFILGAPLSAREPGASYVETLPDLGATFEMVPIPGGEFTMRAMDIDPKDGSITRHEKDFQVTISPFWMQTTEMPYGVAKYWFKTPPNYKPEKSGDYQDSTLLAYRACPWLGFGSDLKDDEPAGDFSQFAAKRFCHWLSLMTGKFYRLPTEAEWEYAYRAGSKGTYPWGDESLSQDLIDEREMKKEWAFRIAQQKPNAWGLHDMDGNVQEWVGDGFSDAYSAFGDVKELKDPIAWPAGRIAEQSDPYEVSDKMTELPTLEKVMYRSAVDGHGPNPERARWLRKYLVDKGQVIALGEGVVRGARNAWGISPTSEYFACNARYRWSKREWFAMRYPHPSYGDNSVYQLETQTAAAIGFRVIRPQKVPPPEVQLWHWGIYEHHEFWLKYTIPPSE